MLRAALLLTSLLPKEAKLTKVAFRSSEHSTHQAAAHTLATHSCRHRCKGGNAGNNVA
jgi:hypothetical protein